MKIYGFLSYYRRLQNDIRRYYINYLLNSISLIMNAIYYNEYTINNLI